MHTHLDFVLSVFNRNRLGFEHRSSGSMPTTQENHGRIVTVYTQQMQIETDVDWIHEIGTHIARGDTFDEALAATVTFAIALVNCAAASSTSGKAQNWNSGFGNIWIRRTRRERKSRLGKVTRPCWREHRVPVATSDQRRKQSEARIFDSMVNRSWRDVPINTVAGSQGIGRCD